MIDNIKAILKGSCAGIMIGLFIFLFINNKVLRHERDLAQEKVRALYAEIEEQNEAVEQMKNESAKQISNLLVAQNAAKKERAIYTKKAKQLMAQNVSSTCDEAIKWGAKQGANIYQCWRVEC